MSSKLEYLKRYSTNSGGRKKKRGAKAKSNYSIIDDDVSWKSDTQPEVKYDDDPDDAPLVAELRDESVCKWQPLSTLEEKADEHGTAHRKRTREGGEQLSDLSPPRRSTHVESDPGPPNNDLSPPRKSLQGRLKKSKHSPEGRDVATSVSELSPPRRTQKMREVDDEKSGRFAATVYRNRVKTDDNTGVAKADEKDEEEFMQWGRGVAQTQAAFNKVQDEEYEMSKPLARFADDEDLEKMLKALPREGDPMLLFTKRKKGNAGTTVMKKKGKPQYQGNMAPNRFGIRPGYRWDGVNRSNGFEAAWISKASNRKAIQETSYKWSVEDM